MMAKVAEVMPMSALATAPKLLVTEARTAAQELLRALDEGRTDAARAAAKQLNTLGIRNRGDLRPRGTQAEPATTNFPDKELLRQVQNRLPSLHGDVAALSAGALGQWGDSETAQVLLQVLQTASEEKVVRKSLHALYIIGGPAARTGFGWAERHPAPEVRDAAAHYRNELAAGGTVDLMFGPELDDPREATEQAGPASLDDGLLPVWGEILADKQSIVPSCKEHKPVQGVCALAPAAPQSGEPPIHALGMALQRKATELEMDANCRPAFRELITRVVDTYPGRPSWDVDLLLQSHARRWPSWAVQCLPSLCIWLGTLPEDGRERAYVWQYILDCVPPSAEYEIIANLCKGQVYDVKMHKETANCIRVFANRFEELRLTNPFPSEVSARCSLIIGIDELLQVSGFPEAAMQGLAAGKRKLMPTVSVAFVRGSLIIGIDEPLQVSGSHETAMQGLAADERKLMPTISVASVRGSQIISIDEPLQVSGSQEAAMQGLAASERKLMPTVSVASARGSLIISIDELLNVSGSQEAAMQGLAASERKLMPTVSVASARGSLIISIDEPLQVSESHKAAMRGLAAGERKLMLTVSEDARIQRKAMQGLAAGKRKLLPPTIGAACSLELALGLSGGTS